MAKLIVPRHTADLEYIIPALKVYYDANDWVNTADYKDRLVAQLIASGKESQRNSDETHYTKCSELLRYFGFLSRREPGKSTSDIKITDSGRDFYEAFVNDNSDSLHELIMEALESVVFGRNNEGCGSDCSCEAPNVIVVSSLLLGGISNKEAAYILGECVEGEDLSTTLLKVKNYRLNKSLPTSSVTTDIKFIPFLKRIGFLDDDADGLTIVRRDVAEKFKDRLSDLAITNDEVSDGNHFEAVTLPLQKIVSDYRPYIAALKTKPFLLLAGISGTGKSRIVRKLAQACWPLNSEQRKAQVPANFCMVQVKPNWHDSSELIGYVSRVSGKSEFVVGDFLKFVAQAWENWLSEDKKPYFLCLDEMNLAPVEQYFAEYLSVLESRKYNAETSEITSDPIIKKDKEDWFRIFTANLTLNDTLREQFLVDGICLPPNLIVVGTVNMDETTFSFSRKVLDRAMVIEMNEVNLNGGLTDGADEWDNVELSATDVLPQFVEGKDFYERNEDTCNSIIEKLGQINDVLDGTPFKIAYRTRNEVLLYILNRMNEECSLEQALDEVVNMKILSRIEGDKNKVVDKEGNALLPKLIEVIKEVCGENEKSPSLLKLEEMKKKLDKQFYCSYWN